MIPKYKVADRLQIFAELYLNNWTINQVLV